MILILIILVFAGNVTSYEVKVDSPGNVSINSTFIVKILVSGENISGVDFQLLFDGNILTAEQLEEGNFLKNFSETAPSPGNNITTSSILFGSVLMPPATASGNGNVAIITFKAKSLGTSVLDIQGTPSYPKILADALVEPIKEVTIRDSSVVVGSGAQYSENQTANIRENATENTTETHINKTAQENKTESALPITKNKTQDDARPIEKNITLHFNNQTQQEKNYTEKNTTLTVSNQTAPENKTNKSEKSENKSVISKNQTQEKEIKKLIIEIPSKLYSGQTIKIKIKDQTNNPVKDAKIFVTLPDGIVVDEKTDANGEISIKTNKEGLVIINAEKNGYLSASDKFIVESETGQFNYLLFVVVIILIIILIILRIKSRG